jgi:hypothetical protein
MKFTLIILFTVLFSACSSEVEDLAPPPAIIMVPPTPLDSLQLSVRTNNVPGDNFSYAEIIAVAKPTSQPGRNIVFTTDKGLFSNNSNTYSLLPGANDTTRAYLRYSKPDLVRVTAALGTYSKELYITFVPAYPTQIFLNPDSTTLPRIVGIKTKITTNLYRVLGTVSEGQQVVYYDSVAAPPPIRSVGGFFNSTLSNSAGVSTSEYRLLDITYTGVVYLKCYADTPIGRIYGQNIIIIQ